MSSSINRIQIEQLKARHGDKLPEIQKRYEKSLISREANRNKGDDFTNEMVELGSYTQSLLKQLKGGSDAKR